MTYINVIIHSIKTVRPICLSVTIRLRPMNCSVVAIAGHIGGIAIKRVPGDKSLLKRRRIWIIQITPRRNFQGIPKSVPVGVFEGIVCQHHRKVTFHCGVIFVLGLDADGVSRGVRFVIEGGGCFERTIGLEGEKGIVTIPCPAYEVVSQSRVGIRIGGIELANHGSDRLVLGDSQGCRGIEVGGRSVDLLERDSKTMCLVPPSGIQ